MISLKQTGQPGQAGFTLVELAIVLVIVGLLIGGILKGQELIAATRVNSTVSQIKAIDASTYTFVDTYGGMPGDLMNASTRLSACASTSMCVPSATGTGLAPALGNGRLENSHITAMESATGLATEGTSFFIQLGVANLIGGINNPSATLVNGQTTLVSPLGNSTNWRAGYPTAQPTLRVAGGAILNAHNLFLSAISPTTDNAGVDAATAVDAAGIAVKAASSVDTKMDDGAAGRGSVRAVGSSNNCVDDITSANAVYRGATTTDACGLSIRFYQ